MEDLELDVPPGGGAGGVEGCFTQIFCAVELMITLSGWRSGLAFDLSFPAQDMILVFVPNKGSSRPVSLV